MHSTFRSDLAISPNPPTSILAAFARLNIDDLFIMRDRDGEVDQWVCKKKSSTTYTVGYNGVTEWVIAKDEPTKTLHLVTSIEYTYNPNPL